jgi:agmatinase
MDVKSFDPNGVGQEGGIFGLPFSIDEAQIALIHAPWGVTVSYGSGTEDAPRAILDASRQIDYFHESYGADSWKIGLAMQQLDRWKDMRALHDTARKKAAAHIEALEHGTSSALPEEVHVACETFHARVEKESDDLLSAGKLVGLVGGDHSTPLGLMNALAKRHGSFGILQIDAHCDLRERYEGFTYSHASIMWNALKIPQVEKLVQVGIRDYAVSERALIEESSGRITTFFDQELKRATFEGASWKNQVGRILEALPQEVYLSFDIDGLDPALCPHTGTPVPGGLSFEEAMYLIRALAESGRRIIGFDLSEVSPGDTSWDANVGMRVLWNLALSTAKSNNLSPRA